MSNAIQPSQPQQLQQAPRRAGSTLAELIASRRESFAQVATKHYDPDRLVKLAQAALSRNQKLAECTPPSVLLCLMKCAELGLEPDSALPQRRMWLVPRWNSKLRGMECTYQLDYRAQLQLARDTGMVSSIVASEVRERDEWSYELSPAGASMTTFSFKPKVFGDRGQVVGYFAAARLAGGEVQVVALSRGDAERHRDRFAQKTKDGSILGPWSSDFDSMAIKTCLRRLWNLLPAGASQEAQKVQAAVAGEEDQPEVEITLPVVENPTTGRADALKAKLAAKAGKAPAAAPAEEPHVELEVPAEEAPGEPGADFETEYGPESGELRAPDESAARELVVEDQVRGETYTVRQRGRR